MTIPTSDQFFRALLEEAMTVKGAKEIQVTHTKDQKAESIEIRRKPSKDEPSNTTWVGTF